MNEIKSKLTDSNSVWGFINGKAVFENYKGSEIVFHKQENHTAKPYTESFDIQK